MQVDKELKAVYEAWLQDHPFDMGQGWAAEPWYQEEMPLDTALAEKLSGQNDAALSHGLPGLGSVGLQIKGFHVNSAFRKNFSSCERYSVYLPSSTARTGQW